MTSRRASRARSSRGCAAPAAAAAAEDHFDRVFRRHEAGEDLQELGLQPDDLEDGAVYLPKVMERWFGLTRSEGRRRIEQGGVSLDGEPVTTLAVPADQLVGRRLKAGKSAKAQGVIRDARHGEVDSVRTEGYTPQAPQSSPLIGSFAAHDQEARTLAQAGKPLYYKRPRWNLCAGTERSQRRSVPGAVRPQSARQGPAVCLRGTRSLKTE